MHVVGEWDKSKILFLFIVQKRWLETTLSWCENWSRQIWDYADLEKYVWKISCMNFGRYKIVSRICNSTWSMADTHMLASLFEMLWLQIRLGNLEKCILTVSASSRYIMGTIPVNGGILQKFQAFGQFLNSFVPKSHPFPSFSSHNVMFEWHTSNPVLIMNKMPLLSINLYAFISMLYYILHIRRESMKTYWITLCQHRSCVHVYKLQITFNKNAWVFINTMIFYSFILNSRINF